MSQGASDASPLLLACERNAPLATIRSLLTAVEADSPNASSLSSLTQSKMTMNVYPGSWIAPHTGGETWFGSSQRCPHAQHSNHLPMGRSDTLNENEEEGSKYVSNSCARLCPNTRSPLALLVNYLKIEKISIEDVVCGKRDNHVNIYDRKIEHNDENKFNFCNSANSSQSLGGSGSAMKKHVILNLLKYAFTNFVSDVFYLNHSSFLSLIDTKISNSLEMSNMNKSMSQEEGFDEILLELLPAMELAQKIGCILHEESAQTTACLRFAPCSCCREVGSGYSRQDYFSCDLKMKDKLCHILNNGGGKFSVLHTASSLIHPNPFLVKISH